MARLRYSHSNQAFCRGSLSSSYRRPPAIRRTVLVKETYIAIVKSSLFYIFTRGLASWLFVRKYDLRTFRIQLSLG